MQKVVIVTLEYVKQYKCFFRFIESFTVYCKMMSKKTLLQIWTKVHYLLRNVNKQNVDLASLTQ